MIEEGQKRPERNPDDHSVFIGGKPFMNYVTGVVMQFTTQNAKEVVVKARGKFISRAVDIAEVVVKRFLENQVNLGNIRIDSEEFENKEGRQVRVSIIEITLTKK
ncbi:MAG: DNA-binding protein Alba [Nanoarchaeota archaeon]|nr:DNA-binding protein Alba [Nanoarchaeota archaeon]